MAVAHSPLQVFEIPETESRPIYAANLSRWNPSEIQNIPFRDRDVRFIRRELAIIVSSDASLARM